jgi:hypothetical protein
MYYHISPTHIPLHEDAYRANRSVGECGNGAAKIKLEYVSRMDPNKGTGERTALPNPRSPPPSERRYSLKKI